MRASLLSGFAALAVLAAPAAAQDAPAWTRFTSPSARLSAELPCGAGMVERLAELPSDVGIGTPLDPANRVMCALDDWIYVAGIVSDPSVAAGDKSAFDLVRDAVMVQNGPENTPRDMMVDGHRAFINREIRADYRADAGFIEVDKTTIVLIMSGGKARTDFDMNAALDRFAQSIRITER